MPEQLSISVPLDLMTWIAAAAGENFRTAEGHVLWLIKNEYDKDRQHSAGAEAREQARKASQQAREALFAELRKLYQDAGLPSFRTVAERVKLAGGDVSHTTVRSVLTGKNVASWGYTADIVTVLDGDVQHFYTLWKHARY